MTTYKIARLGGCIFIIIIFAMAVSTFDIPSMFNSLLIAVFFYFLLKRWKKKIVAEINENKEKEKMQKLQEEEKNKKEKEELEEDEEN